VIPGISTGGGGFQPNNSSSATMGDSQNTAGAVTIGGLNMGNNKDQLAEALKWGLVALAVVAVLKRR